MPKLAKKNSHQGLQTIRVGFTPQRSRWIGNTMHAPFPGFLCSATARGKMRPAYAVTLCLDKLANCLKTMWFRQIERCNWIYFFFLLGSLTWLGLWGQVLCTLYCIDKNLQKLPTPNPSFFSGHRHSETDHLEIRSSHLLNLEKLHNNQLKMNGTVHMQLRTLQAAGVACLQQLHDWQRHDLERPPVNLFCIWLHHAVSSNITCNHAFRTTTSSFDRVICNLRSCWSAST